MEDAVWACELEIPRPPNPRTPAFVNATPNRKRCAERAETIATMISPRIPGHASASRASPVAPPLNFDGLGS